jgi:4-amino-4-deoxy-L-arabinose transferase-like glycosyltransferase
MSVLDPDMRNAGLASGMTGTVAAVASRRPMALLVLLCLLLYLPGIAALPPFDRDEARFAQASKQMLETGDFIALRFQDEARNKKPVGIYWLQAAAAHALTEPPWDAIWAYRLPSMAAALLAVLLAWRCCLIWARPPTALLAAALLASCVILVTEAHLAKTDAGLLAAILAAQFALATLHRAGQDGAAPPGWAAPIFWVAQSAAILLKGPIGPLVSGLTLLTLWILDRRLAWARPLARPRLQLIWIVMVLPWFVAIMRATDGAFVADAVGNDLLPKLYSGHESHGAPPGYYTALLILGFWPGSLLLPLAAICAWRLRADPAVRFLLAWLVPAFLVFEAVPTKLPHYVLPTYPALAMLIALAIDRGLVPARAWLVSWLALWGLFGVTLGVALAIGPTRIAAFAWGPALAGLAACATAAAGVVLMARGRIVAAAATSIAAASVCFAILLQVALPALRPFWLGATVAAAVRQAALPGAPPAALAGFSEPSAVFLLGTRTRLVDGAGAARHLVDRPGAIVAVEAREMTAFRSAAAGLALDPRPLGEVAGFNYSRGRSQTLTLFQAGASPAPASGAR